jgi:Na+/glutamate symporter
MSARSSMNVLIVVVVVVVVVVAGVVVAVVLPLSGDNYFVTRVINWVCVWVKNIGALAIFASKGYNKGIYLNLNM